MMAEKTDVVLDPQDELARDRFQAALSEELASEAQGSPGAPEALRFGDGTSLRLGNRPAMRFGDGAPPTTV